MDFEKKYYDIVTSLVFVICKHYVIMLIRENIGLKCGPIAFVSPIYLYLKRVFWILSMKL